MPAASVNVHEDAPNYGRPKTVCESKKKASERKRTKAMREWQRGAHLPGAVEAVQTIEDESFGWRWRWRGPRASGAQAVGAQVVLLAAGGSRGGGGRGRDAAGAYAEPARNGN